jgi:hypothetical protein
MISTIENGTRKITLPYGMYLTRAFRKFKVSFKGEEGQNSKTEFSSNNLGRMKILSDIPDKDQGVKRKRDLFETAENLEMLATVITTQEDHVENVLPIPTSSEKGKQVRFEDDFSDSRDLGVSLEFDSAFEDNLDSNLNKFTSVSMDGFSTADNPVNTSMFSPLMSSPQTTLESFNSANFLRSLIKNPAPMFPKLPLPIYTDAGTTLPTFPSNFASFSSFCTNVPSDASHPVEIQTAPVLLLPPPPPHPDIPPPKKTKMERYSKNQKGYGQAVSNNGNSQGYAILCHT